MFSDAEHVIKLCKGNAACLFKLLASAVTLLVMAADGSPRLSESAVIFVDKNQYIFASQKVLNIDNYAYFIA